MTTDDALRQLFELGYQHGIDDAMAEMLSSNPTMDNYQEYDRAKYEVIRAFKESTK